MKREIMRLGEAALFATSMVCLAAATASAQTGCGQTAMYFGNGVNNTRAEAEESMWELPALASEGGVVPAQLAVAYNPTEGLLGDVMETMRQKIREDPRFSWNLLNNLAGYTLSGRTLPPSIIERYGPLVADLQSTLSELIATATGGSGLVEDQIAGNHLSYYRQDILNGRRVILVAHSQGNMFANVARVNLETISAVWARSFGIAAVATPAIRHFDGYVTSSGDRIINLLRSLGGTVLPPNLDVPFSLSDLTGHTFIGTYLEAPARTPIVRLLQSLDSRVVYPAVSCPEFELPSAPGTAPNAPLPPVGGGWGDPHLYTWDGLHYGFQSVGEFNLVMRDALPTVQIRTAPYGTSKVASMIVKVAARVGSDRVVISAGTPPTFTVNGVAALDRVSLSSGGEATVSSVRWPDGAWLHVTPKGPYLNVKTTPPSGLRSGLLGDADGNWQNDLTRSTGALVELPVIAARMRELANLWRVDGATSLFDYLPGQSTVTFTDLAFPTGTYVATPTARATCLAAGVTDPGLQADCMMDVTVSGDPTVAAAGLGVPAPACAATPNQEWAWSLGPFLTEQADPKDASGSAWFSTLFDAQAYTPVSLPHTAIPVGQDGLYRATFDLSAVPASLSLQLRADDGLWLYVNGSFVGHWGADWKGGGCVNDTNCGANVVLAPVPITPFLVPGPNTVAVRVTNGQRGSYLSAIPGCYRVP